MYEVGEAPQQQGELMKAASNVGMLIMRANFRAEGHRTAFPIPNSKPELPGGSVLGEHRRTEVRDRGANNEQEIL